MNDNEFFVAAERLMREALLAGDPNDASEYAVEGFSLDDLRNLRDATGGLLNALDAEIENRISAGDLA